MKDIINAARGLVSEDGENPEYDRALTELVCDVLGVSSSENRAEIAKVIDVQPASIEAWDRPVRNLARFSTDDAEAVIGRPLTDGEYRAVVKTLENSSMGEVFSECVEIVTNNSQEG